MHLCTVRFIIPKIRQKCRNMSEKLQKLEEKNERYFSKKCRIYTIFNTNNPVIIMTGRRAIDYRYL